MCEFVVYLVKKGSKEKEVVARNIIKAKKKNGKIILMDASGNVTPVEHVSIEVVDTLMQELILKGEEGEGV